MLWDVINTQVSDFTFTNLYPRGINGEVIVYSSTYNSHSEIDIFIANLSHIENEQKCAPHNTLKTTG